MSFEQPVKSFEEQFALREQLQVAGGTAEVVDLNPSNLKSNVPVVFVEAWACPMEVYKPGLELLYNEGRRVVTFDHPRRGGTEEFETEEDRKAANIRDVVDQKGIEKFDAITHSNGGSNMIKYAIAHPERVRNIIMVAPSGLIGDDSILPMAGRYMKQFTGRTESMNRRFPNVAQTEKDIPLTALKEGSKYVASNPIRAAKEIYDVNNVRIQDMLKELHDKGVGIIIMSSVDDPLYPMDRMQKMVKANMIDGFVSMVGGHGALGDDPAHFMAAAETQLTALEKKKEHSTVGQ